MKTFKQYRALQEARRNPELNPKTNIIEELRPHKDNPDIYISFTKDVGKLSTSRKGYKPAGTKKINKNVSGAKIGMNPQSRYNTPLGIYTYPLKEIWIDLVRDTIPFASREPFVWVLRSKNTSKFVKDVTEDYTNKDYKADIKKIKKISLKGLNEEQHKYLSFSLNRIISNASSGAMFNTEFSRFWNTTRLVANDGDLFGIKGNSPSVRWNVLLRALGYTGFADKSGMQHIHTSEPIQAVFLSKDAFSIVNKVDNKRVKWIAVKRMDDLLNGLDTKVFTVDDVFSYFINETQMEKKYNDWSPVKDILASAKKGEIKFLFHKFKKSSSSFNLATVDYFIFKKEWKPYITDELFLLWLKYNIEENYASTPFMKSAEIIYNGLISDNTITEQSYPKEKFMKKAAKLGGPKIRDDFDPLKEITGEPY